MILLRPIIDVGIFASILILPWYVSVIICIIAAILFKNFYELIFIGILFDALYGIPGKTPVFSIGSAVIFAVISYVRPRVSLP